MTDVDLVAIGGIPPIAQNDIAVGANAIPFQLLNGCKQVVGSGENPLHMGTSSFDLIQGILFAIAGFILAQKAYDEFNQH